MSRSIDIARAFTQLFDDRDWLVKSVIGGLLAAIPVVNIVVLGYEVRLIRIVSRGGSNPLPPWEDYDGLFRDGLRLGIAQIALAMPVLVLFAIPAFAFFGAVVLAASAESEELASGLAGASVLGSTASCAAGLIYALVLGFTAPALIANYARHGTLAACLDFAAITRIIRRNGAEYISAWLAVLLAGMALSVVASVASLIPCLGTLLFLIASLPAGFWIMTVQGHAVGQLLALDEARLAGAPATAPAG